MQFSEETNQNVFFVRNHKGKIRQIHKYLIDLPFLQINQISNQP